MDETKLKQFKELLALTTGSLTKEEYLSFSQKVLEYVKTIKSTTESDLQSISQAVKTAISRIESTASDNYTKTEEKLTKEQESALNDIQFKVEALIAEAQKKIDEVKSGDDGEDADEERVIAEVLKRIPPAPPVELEVTTEDKEELEKQIKELKDLISNISSTRSIGGAPRGIQLKVNGVKQGMVAELDIVGSGVSITRVNGLPTVTITGGSGATAVETPTGAVNGSNTSFTVANAPLYIIVDGISKFETVHYTYLAGALEITDGSPPVQYIRSVYSA